jgi:uncharacterized protein
MVWTDGPTVCDYRCGAEYAANRSTASPRGRPQPTVHQERPLMCDSSGDTALSPYLTRRACLRVALGLMWQTLSYSRLRQLHVAMVLTNRNTIVYTSDAVEFDWDEANEEHIARHDVTPEEAEEALTDPRRIGAPAYNVGTERRRAVLGATIDGRVLFVVFTIRRGKLRVVAARDATTTQRRRYRR